MKDFVFVFVTISLVLIDVFVAQLFSGGIELMLEKSRGWIYMFLLWMGILFLQAAFYSWLPGRIGGEITLFDGLFVLEDGALIRNLGYLLMAHVLGIGMALGKYLWDVIRKRERFYGKMVAMEVVVGGVCCCLAAWLMKSEYVFHFNGGESVGKIVMITLALIGAVFVFLGFRQSRSEKEEKSADTQSSSKENLTRFDQIVEERKRLTGIGDYASQIPLLIEAAGLNVDVTRKSRIWNYMGLAYKEIGSEDKALECFRTAQSIDPGHPSSYMNLAMCYMDRKDFNLALQNADTAIAKAKKRKMIMGQFYANKALIMGLSGDLQKAREHLHLAKDAGCDDKEILSIQTRLGIH